MSVRKAASADMVPPQVMADDERAESDAPTFIPRSREADNLLGTVLGSFRLTRRLGRGGMGTVYLGQHLHIGSRVAIKVLHGRLATHPSVLKRFQVEAQAVNLIGHENIVSILDLHLDLPRPYLIMEYLEGQPLSSLLPGPVPVETVVPLLAQVCDALQATHARGIIHRDLKPENLFLTHRGRNQPFVKVLDFGIAKLQHAEHGTDTCEGTLIGSPDYMSPEQGRGESLDGRSDLYSLGVIAYQLVTGRLPFIERSLAAQLLAHQTRQPPAPHGLDPRVPPALSEAILRALAKKPEERFPDAAAFQAALWASLATPSPDIPQAMAYAPREPKGAPPPRPRLGMPVRVEADSTPPRNYTCSELSRGGMFLHTEGPLPPLLSRMQVVLEPPSGPLACTAEVVRHVTPDEARAWQMAAGFGVQFVEPGVAFRTAIAHLLQGLPLNSLTPAPLPADPAADAEAQRELELYRERSTEDFYAFLALPPDTSCEEVRVRVRRARQALERLRELALSPLLRARVDAVHARLMQAAETLGHPVHRAAYDAERGHFHGVACCLAAGLTVTQLEHLRRDFLVRHPLASSTAHHHFVTARACEASGQEARAIAAYEQALVLDPLALDIQKHYLRLRRKLAGLKPSSTALPAVRPGPPEPSKG